MPRTSVRWVQWHGYETEHRRAFGEAACAARSNGRQTSFRTTLRDTQATGIRTLPAHHPRTDRSRGLHTGSFPTVLPAALDVSRGFSAVALPLPAHGQCRADAPACGTRQADFP